MRSFSVPEETKQRSSYAGIALLAVTTNIIFFCCVYGVWTATGDLMKSDWAGCLFRIFLVFILFIPFAVSKTLTLNKAFDRL